MYNVASPRRIPRCSRLRIPALLLVIGAAVTTSALADSMPAGAGGSTPDDISYFGAQVYSLRQWPPDSGYGLSYRKTFAPHFAASLAYLNDAHFPGHHRDGIAAEAWLPIVPLSDRFTLSVGGGPFSTTIRCSPEIMAGMRTLTAGRGSPVSMPRFSRGKRADGLTCSSKGESTTRRRRRA